MLLHLLSAFTLASTPSAALCSIEPKPLITKELAAREERMWQTPSLEAGPWQNRRQLVVYFVAEPTPDAVYAGMYTQQRGSRRRWNRPDNGSDCLARSEPLRAQGIASGTEGLSES